MWRAMACLWILAGTASGDESLHERIDVLIEQAAGGRVAPIADDAEFLRRITLDLIGRIPTVTETREFLADSATEKRVILIDRLLASPEYARRMRDAWHVILMERAGDNEDWLRFLEQSFAANRPWDALVREMLNPNPDATETRGSAYFLTKRLENYGQQPVDLPGLTRDVGRLLLGVDLQCAQCHDHLFVDDYKQQDFQGLHTFLSHTMIRTDLKFPAVAERVVGKKTEFMSVFLKEPRQTGPRLPFGTELDVPAFPKGDEFAVAPDRKTNFPGKPRFSPLMLLSEQLPAATNPWFVRNGANRIWNLMIGRGLVHPLDLHHAANPPTHPEVLALLASEFAAHQFDMRWMVRELALTRTYQRSSRWPDSSPVPRPESYAVAIEKPLSAEQMLASLLEATGERDRLQLAPEGKSNPALEDLRKRFLAAFANPPRDPEGTFAPSVKAALFLSNDSRVLDLYVRRPGNRTDQLMQQSDDDARVNLAFLSALSRMPSEDERTSLVLHLASHPETRENALANLMWALIGSTEFCVNH